MNTGRRGAVSPPRMRRYTVSGLNEELSLLLGGRYGDVLVEGEVGQLTTPSSGHCYLRLRDRDSALSGVVWRSTWRNLRFRPKVGDRVVCRGRLGVFPARGVYQLYVNQIAPVGEGDLARALEARRARLAADGLLDPERKRPLPRFPRVVGVATSLTGAALQDFLKVSRQRHPATRVLVAGCYVQGDEAPSSVARAVQLLVDDGRAEVIVVTRGGGSKEDLLPFQDEQLARFLADCPVPVLSAVGHQIDTTLVDLVADAVAPTPSAAAVLALPDGSAAIQRTDEATASLERALGRLLHRQREEVDHLSSRLRHPRQRLRGVRSRAAELESRLEQAARRRIQGGARQAADQEREILRAGRATVERSRMVHLELAARLEALSPLAVLARGYAVVSGPSGVVTATDQVSQGDKLEIRLARGRLEAEVQ